MAVLTENGIELRKLNEIVDDETVLWSQKTGDVDVAPSSAAGELIAIKSEDVARFEQDIASVFVSNTIMADGNNLDLFGERKGVYRGLNKPTIAVVSITGINDTFIPEGTSFTSTDNDEVFLTQYDITILAGVASVAVESVNYGVTCTANSLSLTTPIIGVTTATNSSSGVVGYENESDSAYRVRIGQFGTATTQIKDGLYLALLGISGVARARVVDNNTDSILYGEVPPRHFAPVVQGGNSVEIADVVYNFMQCGNPSFGSEINTVKSIRGELYSVYFTRATEQLVVVEIDYTADITFDTLTGEATLVSKAIEFLNLMKIGETLYVKKIEAYCFISGVTSITIDINGFNVDLVPNWDTILITNSDNVSIVG